MGSRSLSTFITLAFALIFATSRTQAAPEKTTFPSGDGLLITADVYIQNTDKQTPLIVLFHQASWSRGEYLETAERLNSLGFNCMAIDQRSGGTIKGVTNETKQRASAAGLGTSFVDAIPDMLAAIAHAKANYANGSVIGMGSSYSSALILKLAGDDGSLVDGVASFSPGEYFTPSNWIRTSAMNITGPVFITSRKDEGPNWAAIFNAIPSGGKVSFLPTSPGQHGSRALWPEFSDSESYWDELGPFLSQWIPSIQLYRERHNLAEDGSDDLLSTTADGMTNLMKYALGVPPSENIASSDLPQLVEVEGEQVFQLMRLKNRSDIIYSVEVNQSLDGIGWREIWSSESAPYGGGVAPSEQVSVTPPAGSVRLFLRLRVALR